MIYTRLGYLHLILKKKFNYRYSTQLLKQDNICIYNFESIAEIIK